MGQTLPYGSWPSPITARSLVAGAVGISEVVPDGDDIWWAESRPDEGGRVVLVRWRAGELTEMTPADCSVRTLVHEYGGGSWWVEAGVVFYVDLADQRLRRLDTAVPSAEPQFLTPTADIERGLRYADGRPTPDGSWYVCVREQHHGDGTEATNEVVAVATDGSMQVDVLVSGADFYACPRPSPDGTRLAWVQWNHPNMPWDDTELWTADMGVGALTGGTPQAGGVGQSVWQPEWSPSGELHWLSDIDDFWKLYRSGSDTPVLDGPGEISCPGWVFGTSRYTFLDDGAAVAVWYHDGAEHLAGYPELTMFGTVRSHGSQPVFAGASWADETSVVAGPTVIRAARDHGVAAGFLPDAEAITFPTTGNDHARALYYAPAHPDVDGPADERPPLLVLAHGGPTSNARTQLDLAKRYWTSRGIAVVDVDYRGSVGYGRAYRQKLNGQWGIADVDDCVAAAHFLVGRGDVDGDRLMIKGGSAGGFTVLAALAFHDVFAAGASRYGVADLEVLATDTHKFESRYLDTLVGPYPEARDVYVARSPIHHVASLSAPMIVLQGSDDAIVPPNQSRMIVEALEAKGVRVEYLEFEGEQHGFRQADNIVAALEAELAFFGEVLGFEPVP
ncbi:MAG: S9 family peptidase [Acidimicrobiales bacterium]